MNEKLEEAFSEGFKKEAKSTIGNFWDVLSGNKLKRAKNLRSRVEDQIDNLDMKERNMLKHHREQGVDRYSRNYAATGLDAEKQNVEQSLKNQIVNKENEVIDDMARDMQSRRSDLYERRDDLSTMVYDISDAQTKSRVGVGAGVTAGGIGISEGTGLTDQF